MFNKNDSDTEKVDVFRPAKGSAKVIIGNGVKFKGEITNADEIYSTFLLSINDGCFSKSR